MSQAVDFYQMPFVLSNKEKLKRKAKGLSTEEAKLYCRRIYLDLSFIEDLELNPTQLNVKAVYTATSMHPVLIVEDKLKINNYVSLGATLQAEKEGLSAVPPTNSIMIGYKHFDKWKFEDGSQIGDFQGSSTPNKVLKLQRMIQRKVLGFWRYWTLRWMKKI